MWEPMCPRMQMLLLHTRGDGLCNGEQEQHAERAGMRQTHAGILQQMLRAAVLYPYMAYSTVTVSRPLGPFQAPFQKKAVM